MAINVLVVEAETALRNLIATTLERADFTLYEACNLSEALVCLRTQKINVVVLDAASPDTSLQQALESLADLNTTGRLPVIVMAETSSNPLLSVESEEPFLVLSTITKPFAIYDLIRRIKAVVKTGAFVLQ